MKAIFKMRRLMVMLLIGVMVLNSTVRVRADEVQRRMLNSRGEVTFEGTIEECDTYEYYVKRRYSRIGCGYYADGTMFSVTYNYGNDLINFNFNTRKMKWIDGTYWNITYNGSLAFEYIYRSQELHYTDDAIRMFCPEFAATHSLIPEDAPANFSTVLARRKEILGLPETNVVDQDTVNSGEASNEQVEESYETFNEIDYAERYPDVKEAFGLDKQQLWNHYQLSGKEEGRIALFDVKIEESYETFNEIDYAERYPDAKAAFGTDKQLLWNHYQICGKQEGRIALFNSNN